MTGSPPRPWAGAGKCPRLRCATTKVTTNALAIRLPQHDEICYTAVAKVEALVPNSPCRSSLAQGSVERQILFGPIDRHGRCQPSASDLRRRPI